MIPIIIGVLKTIPKRIGQGTIKLRNQRTSGGHLNYSIIQIDKNTEKSPGILKLLLLKPLWKPTCKRWRERLSRNKILRTTTLVTYRKRKRNWSTIQENEEKKMWEMKGEYKQIRVRWKERMEKYPSSKRKKKKKDNWKGKEIKRETKKNKAKRKKYQRKENERIKTKEKELKRDDQNIFKKWIKTTIKSYQWTCRRFTTFFKHYGIRTLRWFSLNFLYNLFCCK